MSWKEGPWTVWITALATLPFSAFSFYSLLAISGQYKVNQNAGKKNTTKIYLKGMARITEGTNSSESLRTLSL